MKNKSIKIYQNYATAIEISRITYDKINYHEELDINELLQLELNVKNDQVYKRAMENIVKIVNDNYCFSFWVYYDFEFEDQNNFNMHINVENLRKAEKRVVVECIHEKLKKMI